MEMQFLYYLAGLVFKNCRSVWFNDVGYLSKPWKYYSCSN